MKRLRAQWWLYPLLALAMLVFVACSGTDESQDASSSSQGTRTIEHAMGTAEVPQNPERMVVLDYGALENILALGVQPVGVPLNSNLDRQPELIRQRLQGDPETFRPGQPNLERLLQLEPDLILGSKPWIGQHYERLSQIAPTVVTETNNMKWQANLKFHGRMLGRSERAQQLLDEYQQRLVQFRQQRDAGGELEVSVGRIFPDRVRLYLKDSFSGNILQKAGLKRPTAQDKDTYSQKISKEQFQMLDGDVMFAIVVGQEARATLDQFRQDALWSQLSVVQSERVYPVPGYWVGSSILAANQVVDDLERHLLDG